MRSRASRTSMRWSRAPPTRARRSASAAWPSPCGSRSAWRGGAADAGPENRNGAARATPLAVTGDGPSVGGGPGLLLEHHVTLDGEDAASVGEVEELDQLG